MKVLILGVGSFAHGAMGNFQRNGDVVGCYLTRDYGHFGAQSTGKTWLYSEFPSPLPVIEEFQPDLVVPMSIDWSKQPWSEELTDSCVPILSPIKEAMKIEFERDFAKDLCRQHGVPFPASYFARNHEEALRVLENFPAAYVLKNPICGPASPIHTIVCESMEETQSWLESIDYQEGVFLQEYLGSAEAGHFVAISGGAILSLATNQEYRRAFSQNLGPIAGAPLGGILEQDPQDRYGLARELIHPLLPWFQKENFKGILQVTAVKKNNQWHAIEYNVRLGVTSGNMLLGMLEEPSAFLRSVVNNERPTLRFKPKKTYSCSLTLAGYGYPFEVPHVPKFPIELLDSVCCDLWWNEVVEWNETLYSAPHNTPQEGHRIADCIHYSDDLQQAIHGAYENIKKIKNFGSYYRPDIGQSLWPIGTGY